LLPDADSSLMKQIVHLVTVLLLLRRLAAVDCVGWDLKHISSYNSSFNEGRQMDTLYLLDRLERMIMHCTIPMMRTMRDTRATPDWR